MPCVSAKGVSVARYAAGAVARALRRRHAQADRGVAWFPKRGQFPLARQRQGNCARGELPWSAVPDRVNETEQKGNASAASLVEGRRCVLSMPTRSLAKWSAVGLELRTKAFGAG